MKRTHLILTILLFFGIQTHSYTQVAEVLNDIHQPEETVSAKTHLNFFVISKRKKGKLDMATRFNTLRTKLRSLFHRRKFVSIVAEDVNEMHALLKEKLTEQNATLGTVWFDSHGAYKKGYSLFMIGQTEISPATLSDASVSKAFSDLSAFATPHTKIVIGSCYGGATYTRPSIDYKDTTRMNGDSLMIRLGNLIGTGEVFGSEAWVMSKPRLFHRRPAAGGAPARKLFLDLCYEPVWARVGQWNQYKASTRSFEKVNTVALDKKGNMVIRGRAYCEEKKFYADVQKKLTKLEPHLYK